MTDNYDISKVMKIRVSLQTKNKGICKRVKTSMQTAKVMILPFKR